MSHPPPASSAGVRLASIHVYPMKAARAVDLDRVPGRALGPGGRPPLAPGRRGRPVHEPARRALAGPRGGHLRIAGGDDQPSRRPAFPAAGSPRPPTRRAQLLKVTVWGSTVLAAAAGPAADAWFSGLPGPPGAPGLPGRPDPAAGRPRATGATATSSASPTGTRCCSPAPARSTSSADWLTEDGEQPVPMTRFRPSVVVTGARPGPKTTGAASASAPSCSAWSSPAADASSPPPTRSPANAARSR